MKSKEKSLGGENRSRGIHKPKGVTVAEGSMQTRAPGAVMPGGPESPFRMASTGSRQSDTSGQRAGASAVYQGWSARQRGERMQAQAEQARLGESRQSGQGGAEQYQNAGSQQSDSGSKPNKKNSGS
jgi:hypothetical protein